MRVDYIPERVDLAALRGGKYAKLVNLVPWKVGLLLASPVVDFCCGVSMIGH